MALSALLKAHFPTWTAPTPVEGMSPAAACQKEVLAALRGVSTWAGCHTAGFQCGTITGKRQQVDAYTAHASNLAARTGSTSGPVVCETGLFRGGSATVWLCSSPHARLIAFDLVVDPNVSAVLHHYFPGRVTLVQGSTIETIPVFSRNNPQAQCDIVSVDGGHFGYVPLLDLRNLRAMASPGALVLMDEVGFLDVSNQSNEVGQPLLANGERACCPDTTLAWTTATVTGLVRQRSCFPPSQRNGRGWCEGVFSSHGGDSWEWGNNVLGSSRVAPSPPVYRAMRRQLGLATAASGSGSGGSGGGGGGSGGGGGGSGGDGGSAPQVCDQIGHWRCGSCGDGESVGTHGTDCAATPLEPACDPLLGCADRQWFRCSTCSAATPQTSAPPSISPPEACTRCFSSRHGEMESAELARASASRTAAIHASTFQRHISDVGRRRRSHSAFLDATSRAARERCEESPLVAEFHLPLHYGAGNDSQQVMVQQRRCTHAWSDADGSHTWVIHTLQGFPRSLPAGSMIRWGGWHLSQPAGHTLTTAYFVGTTAHDGSQVHALRVT